MASEPKKFKRSSSEHDEFRKNIPESDVVVSKFFNDDNSLSCEFQPKTDLCNSFFTCVHKLNDNLRNLKFSRPIEFVYNPTEYAFDVFKNYIERYCSDYKTIMYLGMNPGPWGMSQTGVPFGEISAVTNWLQLHGNVTKPLHESPLRPVQGFDCTRSEVSGKRFWGFVKKLCGTPEVFFKSSFVYNYCPLQLITSSGKNITPAELKKEERETLFDICDTSFIEALSIYRVNIILCIGRFVETRVISLLKSAKLSDRYKILRIPHPSPRAVGNNNWQEKTLKLMETLELLPYYKH